MLLNLLIATLSTAHAQVEENVGRGSRKSKARIIAYYRTVVEKELLPAPFSLVHLVLSLVALFVLFPCCCGVAVVCSFASPRYDLPKIWEVAQEWKKRSISTAGRVAFWALLTAVDFAGAIVPNVLACAYALYLCYEQDEVARPRKVKHVIKTPVPHVYVADRLSAKMDVCVGDVFRGSVFVLSAMGDRDVLGGSTHFLEFRQASTSSEEGLSRCRCGQAAGVSRKPDERRR